MQIVTLLGVVAALLPIALSAALPNPNPDINIIIDLLNEVNNLPSDFSASTTKAKLIGTEGYNDEDCTSSGRLLSESKIISGKKAEFTPPPPPPPPPMPECIGSWNCPAGKMCKEYKCVDKKPSMAVSGDENSETVLY
ncbi:hypothetical protein IFR05_002547 [Cadophora sp. M221]|nr:hypothetical protein IFR05_002547 [Cadophora sp. M221]